MKRNAKKTERTAAPSRRGALGCTSRKADNARKETAVEIAESAEAELFKNVREILASARAAVYTVANAAMVEAYWNVGREIVEKQGGAARAKYGDGLIKRLSVRLTAEFGEGFTSANLFNMRQFYLAFPKFYTLCRELSWSHYRILMRVENEQARQYYLEERNLFAVKYHLHLPTVEELQRELLRERAAIEEALLLAAPANDHNFSSDIQQS